MLVQIRYSSGKVINERIDNLVDLDAHLSNREVEKVSFDLFPDGTRIALRTDGTYQIFGGLINYPRIY